MGMAIGLVKVDGVPMPTRSGATNPPAVGAPVGDAPDQSGLGEHSGVARWGRGNPERVSDRCSWRLVP